MKWWQPSGPPMPHFVRSSSPAHSPTLLFLIYETPSVWESGRELRWEVEAEEMWGVVIAMDPFLYESWHCHMGRAAFWREVMVSSPPAAPWGGLSVNYIQLSLCSVKTGADSHPPPTFPSLLITSYNLRERYSHLARTQWDISEEIACLHVILLTLFFSPLSHSSCLSAQASRSTWATAAHPQLSLCMLWETPLDFSEGGKEVEYEGKAAHAQNNSPDPLKSDWKCQSSLDGRQSRERQTNGWQTVFHGLSGQDPLSSGHTVSH